MKKFFSVALTLCWLLLGIVTANALAQVAVEDPAPAPAVSTTESSCGNVNKDEVSEVNQFFKSVQCTLEKAKPWVDEIEKEAKKLEESAKKFGEGVISKLSDLMEKWISGDNSTSTTTEGPEDIESIPAEVNEISNEVSRKCADGQIPDVDGKCQQVV